MKVLASLATTISTYSLSCTVVNNATERAPPLCSHSNVRNPHASVAVRPTTASYEDSCICSSNSYYCFIIMKPDASIALSLTTASYEATIPYCRAEGALTPSAKTRYSSLRRQCPVPQTTTPSDAATERVPADLLP